jgi:hypothetical protein
MLMFNGFAQIRKTYNTDHPLQYSANDNYFTAQINTTINIHVVTTISAVPFYNPNLITKKNPFLTLVLWDLRTGWIKTRLFPEQTARIPKYRIVLITRSKWLFFTYVTTRSAFEKIPLTVFALSNPNCCHFSQTSFSQLLFDEFPLLRRTQWFLFFTYHWQQPFSHW